MKKIAIDLFCCSGGFSHGWIEGGGEIALAVDMWEDAILNHEYNHPEVQTLQMTLGGDIKETSDRLKKYLNSKADFHFHLHGSPPCTSISTASNHDAKDGMFLVNWFIELVEEMKPDSWSMENVKGVCKFLDKKTQYVELNSADFGVPQIRKRIFAGIGWEAIKTHQKTDWITTKEALKIPFIKNDRIVSRRRKKNEKPQFYTPCKPSHTITQVNHIIERLKENGDYESVRSYTINELCSLQGWPDMKFLDFTFQQKKLMVANMIPPQIAKAICEGIEIKEV